MVSFKDKIELSEIFVTFALILFYIMSVVIYGLFIEGALFERDPDETVTFFDKTIFYWSMGGLAILTIVFVSLMKFIVKGNRKLMDKFGWASVEYIHDPEESPISKISRTITRFISSPINTIFISLIFFSIIGLLGVLQQQFFFAPLPTEFQATGIAKLIFAVEPASTMETLMFFSFMLIQDGFLFWLLTRKLNVKFDSYQNLSLFIIPALIGIEWMGFHLLRYGGSDVALQTVFFFGFFGALVTKLFGTIIIWEIWHITNNLFFKLSRLFDSDIIVGVTVSILIGMIILFIMILGLKNKSRANIPTLAS